MNILSLLSKPLAAYTAKQTHFWSRNAVLMQQRIFQQLLHSGKNTLFGRDHWITSVKSYEEYREQIPIRDYEAFRPYIDRIKNGEENVFLPDRIC